MKHIFTLTLAILLALQPVSAQNNNEQGEYKYFKAVELYEDGGDLKEVAKILNENISEHPKHIPSYFLLTTVYRRERDYSSALRVIDAAAKNNYKKSGSSDSLFPWWKASIYSDMGETEKAVEYIEQAIKKAKKDNKEKLVDMYFDLGQYYFELDNFQKSDEAYNAILKIEEANQAGMVGLARNMIERKEYDAAISKLQECMKYDAKYEGPYRYLVQAYEGKGEYKKMIDAMVKTVDLTEDFDYWVSKYYMKDTKYAIAKVKSMIASSKDKEPFWKLALASIYEDCHMYEDILPIINELMNEYGADDQLLSTRAEVYESLGMFELAIADMTRALETSTDPVYNRARRANMYEEIGMYEEALADYTAYIEANPTYAGGYYARGWCKELAGDDEGAMEDYNQGIAVSENHAYIYLMRGEMHKKYGREEEARADFEKVLQIDTVATDGSTRHYALHFVGNDDEAIEWMEKIIEEDSKDSGNWYDKACLLARMGRLEESVSALETSLDKGFVRFLHIEKDDDMDPIREREDFKELVAKYKALHEEKVKRLTPSPENSEQQELVSEIAMKKQYGGTYEVDCAVNGLPLKMIFDTGASDVTISSVEANFMLKNGYLSRDDIKGKQRYQTASGDIHEGTVIRLKEVKLGDAVLKNIEASVVHSQKAPLLLGQSVLERFGTITIDNVNSRLLIKQ